jgi:hypothetical protein
MTHILHLKRALNRVDRPGISADRRLTDLTPGTSNSQMGAVSVNLTNTYWRHGMKTRVGIVPLDSAALVEPFPISS